MPDDELLAALAPSVVQGAIGERSLQTAIERSDLFVAALPDCSSRLIDLGSGGGLPGLVIAWRRPDLTVRLVDRRGARTDLLRRSVARLGMSDRVEVVNEDAMRLATDPRWVAWADVVTARSFANPDVTVACAAPLLSDAGCLIVSAPPSGDIRWTTLTPHRQMAIDVSSPGVLRITFRSPT